MTAGFSGAPLILISSNPVRPVSSDANAFCKDSWIVLPMAPDEKVCKAFDVMKLKSMYGRQYIGIDRSTFIVGVDGKIIKEWRSVKVTGHVDEVLNTIKDLG